MHDQDISTHAKAHWVYVVNIMMKMMKMCRLRMLKKVICQLASLFLNMFVYTITAIMNTATRGILYGCHHGHCHQIHK